MKLTFAPVVRASWLFKIRRLTSRSRAGTVRTLVAVGMARLASMLATIREAAPRSGVASSVPAATVEAGTGAAATGRAASALGTLVSLGPAVGAWGAGCGAGTGAGR